MTPIDQFRETIKIPGTGDIKAFRMDGKGKTGMRRHVKLGDCNCCDHFYVEGNKVVLVEDTHLLRKIKEIRRKVHYLNPSDMEDYVIGFFRQENYVKVYGALLVLCLLSSKHREVKECINDKKKDFVLVADGIKPGEIKSLDRIKDSLITGLRSVLGSLVGEIRVIERPINGEAAGECDRSLSSSPKIDGRK